MTDSLNVSVEDNGVTMVDVLRDEEALEEDAHAVLGGSDDKFCTYSKVFQSKLVLSIKFIYLYYFFRAILKDKHCTLVKLVLKNQ